MDIGEIRELVRRPSRRTAWMGVAACLLAVPITWSVRQSQLTREAIDRATAAEKTAEQARSDVEETRARLLGEAPRDLSVRRSRHDDPAEIERVRKLYDEIDGLARIHDDIDQTLRIDRVYVPKKK